MLSVYIKHKKFSFYSHSSFSHLLLPHTSPRRLAIVAEASSSDTATRTVSCAYNCCGIFCSTVALWYLTVTPSHVLFHRKDTLNNNQHNNGAKSLNTPQCVSPDRHRFHTRTLSIIKVQNFFSMSLHTRVGSCQTPLVLTASLLSHDGHDPRVKVRIWNAWSWDSSS